MQRLLLLLVLLSFLPAARARADDFRDDGPRRGQPRVILYQHADFGGDSLVLYPGESIDNFSGRSFANGNKLNDAVSSIRVEGGAEVFVYENGRYRGQSLRLNDSVRDLTSRSLTGTLTANWNDRISSIRVERGPGRPGGGPRPVDVDVAIKRAFNDLLGREPGPDGLRDYRSRMIEQNWTEAMVRDHLRQSDEFRREGVDRIIRRAYQDVLGREPDPSGLKQFRWTLEEKNWTETDVRDALRKSDEYRRKNGGR
jgi:hypothetical protein